jgi:hypothetical protein
MNTTTSLRLMLEMMTWAARLALTTLIKPESSDLRE